MSIEHTTVNCGEAPQITQKPDGTFDVKLNNPEWKDLLFGFELDEIISHFDEEKILEHIGKDAAIEKFNLFTEYELLEIQEELDKLKREQDFNDVIKEGKERIAEQKSTQYINFEENTKNS